MAALRSISSAVRTSIRRAPTAFAAPRRGYAEAVLAAAASDKLKLSLVLPHSSLFTSADVSQVNIAAASGDMGILANHVPSVEPLRPGVVEVFESNSGSAKKWFVSGGFAIMHPNNSLTINAVEAAPLEEFSPEAVRQGLAEAQKTAGGSGSEESKIEARIEVEVYEALQHAMSK